MLRKILLILSLIRKGGIYTMVDVYVTLIVLKRRTIDQVPVHLQPVVLADLGAMGLDGSGNPIQS